MNRWYGSLSNRLLETGKCAKPEVGMGATELAWSDREPFEVIAVKDDRHCTVRHMKAVPAPGETFPVDEWVITPDPDGYTVNLFLTKKGDWVERTLSGTYGNKFAIGYACRFHDPSF